MALEGGPFFHWQFKKIKFRMVEKHNQRVLSMVYRPSSVITNAIPIRVHDNEEASVTQVWLKRTTKNMEKQQKLIKELKFEHVKANRGRSHLKRRDYKDNGDSSMD